MKNCELKEYLNTFPDDADISLILGNPKERKLYPVEQVDFIADMGQPVFIVTVGSPKDIDKKMSESCEEDEFDGQMDITDFPEVMP